MKFCIWLCDNTSTCILVPICEILPWSAILSNGVSEKSGYRSHPIGCHPISSHPISHGVATPDRLPTTLSANTGSLSILTINSRSVSGQIPPAT